MKKAYISFFILIIVLFSLTPINTQNTTMELLWKYQLESWSYDIDINSIAISSDGSYIIASNEQDVYLFNGDSKEFVWRSYIGSSPIAISSDGSYIIAEGGFSKKILFYSRDSRTPLWEYLIHYDIISLDMSSDGKYFVAATDGNKVWLFSNDSRSHLWIYQGSGDNTKDVAISSDGLYIAAISGSNMVYLFSRDNSKPLWKYQADLSYNVIHGYSITLSFDGSYIAVGSGNMVYLFNRDSQAPLWFYETDEYIDYVKISYDGYYIIAGSGDTIYLFNRDNSAPLWSSQIENRGDAAISPDGSYIVVVSGSYDKSGTVYLFSRENRIPLTSYIIDGGIKSVALSYDGSYLAVGSGYYLSQDMRKRMCDVYLFGVNSVRSIQSSVTSSVVSSKSSLTRTSASASTRSTSVSVISDMEGSTVVSSDSSGDGLDSGTGFSIAYPTAPYLLVGGICGVLVVAVVMMYRRRGGRVSVIHCPKCGAENPVEQKYCGNCAFNLEDKTQIY